jgi:hypothetical protein
VDEFLQLLLDSVELNFRTADHLLVAVSTACNTSGIMIPAWIHQSKTLESASSSPIELPTMPSIMGQPTNLSCGDWSLHRGEDVACPRRIARPMEIARRRYGACRPDGLGQGTDLRCMDHLFYVRYTRSRMGSLQRPDHRWGFRSHHY